MFKHFLLSFLFPFPLCILTLFAGLFCLLLTSKQKLGKYLLILGVFFLVLFGNIGLSDIFMRTLEDQYPTFSVQTLPNRSDIRYVVVLGGLFHYAPDLPITSQLGSVMLTRLVEGIRLYRQLPHSHLILSGRGPHRISEAEAMQQLALDLGVPSSDIILEKQSVNTYKSAVLLKETLGTTPFILVTSANHMPRAMRIFQDMGMHPIAAPTAHLAVNDAISGMQRMFPRLDAFASFHSVVYEYLGFVKERLRRGL